jgi:hypothetical protein
LNNTVFRAALSRSSFQEGTGEYNRLATNAPWNADLSGNWNGTNGIPANQVTLDQGFAGLGASGGCTVANVTSAPAACFAGVRVHLTDPNYRPAVSNQWNLSVQRQFGSATTLQAAYVGQHNDHLATIVNANQGFLYLAGCRVAQPAPGRKSGPRRRRPGSGEAQLTTGQANYNALQLSFQQRLNTGPVVPGELHLVQMPDQQQRLLRTVWRRRGQPGQQRHQLPAEHL